MKMSLTKNSVTLTTAEKDYAEEQYNLLINEVRNAIEQSDLKANVYLGGSLAIQAPSLCFNGKRLAGVESDIDFFVSVQSEGDLVKARILLEATNTQHPEIERSFHIFLDNKLNRNYFSSTVDDLLYRADDPVIKRFDGAYNFACLSPKTMVYLLVTKANLLVLPSYTTTHPLTNVSNNLIKRSNMCFYKFALTCLRLQYYGTIANTFGYEAIPTLQENGFFDDLLPSQDIKNLLFKREHFDPNQPLPKINQYELLRKSLLKQLGLSFTTDTAELLNTCQNVYFNNMGALGELTFIRLIYALYRLQPCEYKQQKIIELLKLLPTEFLQNDCNNLQAKDNIIAAAKYPFDDFIQKTVADFTQLNNFSLIISAPANQ